MKEFVQYKLLAILTLCLFLLLVASDTVICPRIGRNADLATPLSSLFKRLLGLGVSPCRLGTPPP